MPDVLEPPALPKIGFFTKENARLYQAKAAQARRLAAQAPPPLLPPKEQVASPDFRLALLSEQIALTRDSLNSPKLEPKDRAQLVRALCGLLDQQRIAKGEPLPGSKRPAPERATKAREAGAWLAVSDPPAAQAETPAPARPLGWEYDVPTAAKTTPTETPETPTVS